MARNAQGSGVTSQAARRARNSLGCLEDHTVHTVKGLIRSIRWTIRSGPKFRHFFHTVARGPGGPRRCQVFWPKLKWSSGTEGILSCSVILSTSNAFQQMFSMNLSSAQRKEWIGEPLVSPREYSKTYAVSVGWAYKAYVWVIERYSSASDNIRWKWIFCDMERVEKILSIVLT